MSGPAFHHRTYSQSRFPPAPSYSGGAPGLSTLERGQRSKSFDNRRDFWGGAELVSPRTHFVSDKVGGDGFFNESISIPIQRTDISGQYQPTAKQYRSAAELNSASAEAAAEDDEWTSYDRTVRYNHHRTELPPVALPQRAPYEYSSRRQHTHNYYPEQHALRYSDADYASQQQQQQQQYQQYQQQQQQHGESYYRQHHSDYGRNQAAGGYDDEYAAGGASMYGRSTGGAAAAASSGGHAGGGGYRAYRYETHRSGGGGGGGSRSYSQHYASNGYSHGAQSAHHKSHVNTSRGGLFGGRDKSKLSSSYYHYRDASLPAPKRRTAHHKVHCCCFSFYWPPWGYEPCEPPTPIFYSRKAFTRSGAGGPPSWGVTPQVSPRPYDPTPPFHPPPPQQHQSPPPHQPMEPLPPLTQVPPNAPNAPQPLQTAPSSLLHPNQASGQPPPHPPQTH